MKQVQPMSHLQDLLRQAPVETITEDIKAVKLQERFGQITQDAIVKAQEQATQDLNQRCTGDSRHRTTDCVSPAKRALQHGRACIIEL